MADQGNKKGRKKGELSKDELKKMSAQVKLPERREGGAAAVIKKRKKKKSGALVAVILAVLLIIAGILGYIFFLSPSA